MFELLCHRQPPGTLKEGLAEQLGLVSKEVSIVMTDVQGSSRLWEWYALALLSLYAACIAMTDVQGSSCLWEWYAPALLSSHAACIAMTDVHGS